jgi:hypothetical protein
VVTLDPIVLVLAVVMACGRNQLVDHVRQRRRLFSDDLAGVTVNSQDSGEERARSGDVTAL